MNNQFFIKTVALVILENIYLKSDNNFIATINVNDFIGERIDMAMMQKAAKYLKEKNYIQYDVAPYDKWTVTMTATGVDWLEDCHNINPVDYN